MDPKAPVGGGNRGCVLPSAGAVINRRLAWGTPAAHQTDRMGHEARGPSSRGGRRLTEQQFGGTNGAERND